MCSTTEGAGDPASPPHLHDELVRARDELEAVRVVKLLRDVVAKGVAGATRRDTPALAVVRIAPQEVAHGALVRDLRGVTDKAVMGLSSD